MVSLLYRGSKVLTGGVLAVSLLAGCFAPAPAPQQATATPSPTAAAQQAAVAAPSSPTATSSPAATATRRPPTATSTASPSPQPPTPTLTLPAPTSAPAVAASEAITAPVLLAPEDGMVFTDMAGDTQILLEWSPVKPALAADEYYRVTLNYQTFGQTWTDTVTTQNTNWLVNEHDYLRGMADDGLYTWMVTLIRQVSAAADDTVTELELGPPSQKWAFVWQVVQPGSPPTSTPVSDQPVTNNNNNDNSGSDGGSDSNDNSNNDGSGGIGFPSYP